jgi:hypothetical protein
MTYLDNAMEELADYLIFIHLKNGSEKINITGFLSDGSKLSFNTGANFSQSGFAGMVEGFKKGAAKNAVSKIPIIGDFLSSMVDKEYTTLAQTYKGYDTSTISGFSFSFIVIPGYNNVNSYSEIIRDLNKLVLPKVDENTGKLLSYLYDISDTTGLSNSNDVFENALIHVSIGNWFSAAGLFCTSISHNFSNQMDENGIPLYLEVSMEFEPHRLLKPDEVASWFKIKKNSKG